MTGGHRPSPAGPGPQSDTPRGQKARPPGDGRSRRRGPDSQWLLILVLSAGQIGAAAILRTTGSSYFHRFFGGLDPVLVAALACAFGAGSLAWLRRHRWFEIHRAGAGWRAFLPVAAAATALALVMILFDVFVTFPADINVPPPDSLLFYPLMGYVVECAFHAMPLALLLTLVRTNTDPRAGVFWLIVVVVALLEPVFQTRAAPPAGFPLWASAYVGLHIFAINLIQLVVFTRRGFVSMYGFRLVYYLWWHIVWGWLRLGLLF